MSTQSLKNKALSGSAWTIVGFGFSRVLRLLGHLVLARLLAPQMFGLMALVAVLLHGMNMFSDLGIGHSIIQNKRGSDPDFLNTAWTVKIIRGFAIWLITCLLTWPLAWFYAQNDPTSWQLLYILPVLAFGNVLNGFDSPNVSLLTKEMRFARLTLIELGIQLISLVVTITWALIHPTVWALVAGWVVTSICWLISSHMLIPGHRVRLGWSKECSLELLTFGRWIFLSTIFTFLASRMDTLVLGKILSLSELGLYSIAVTIATIALEVATKAENTVMFPVYSKLQDDPERLMAVALRTRELVLLTGAAVCIAIAAGSPFFFEILWDSRYQKASMIAQWLTIYFWMEIMLQSMDRIPLALGNSRALFLANIIKTSGIFSAIAGYWLAGIPGFVVGMAFGPAAAHLFLLRYLPSKRPEMLSQGIRFTIIVALVGALAVGTTLWTQAMYSPIIWIGSVLLAAGIPLMTTAIIAYRRIWCGERIIR